MVRPSKRSAVARPPLTSAGLLLLLANVLALVALAFVVAVAVHPAAGNPGYAYMLFLGDIFILFSPVAFWMLLGVAVVSVSLGWLAFARLCLSRPPKDSGYGLSLADGVLTWVSVPLLTAAAYVFSPFYAFSPMAGSGLAFSLSAGVLYIVAAKLGQMERSRTRQEQWRARQAELDTRHRQLLAFAQDTEAVSQALWLVFAASPGAAQVEVVTVEDGNLSIDPAGLVHLLGYVNHDRALTFHAGFVLVGQRSVRLDGVAFSPPLQALLGAA